MRYLVFIIISIWLFSAAALRAQEVTPAPQTPPAGLSIEDVIANQLDAFTDRDVEEAWRYASPFIQGLFGNPQNFGAMVERGYPMVWNNDSVRFLEVEDVGGRTIQRITIRDADGRTHFLEYEMLQTPGGWQINGVGFFEPDLSA